MEDKSNMELIKEYIETCPLLENGKINVDYLKDDIQSYSIDRQVYNPIYKQYRDGGVLKQIIFDFTVQAPLSSDAIDNLANSKFCDDFMDWIEKENRKGNKPKIKGVQWIKCTSPRIHFGKNRNYSNLYYTNASSL